jgi:hypothetical protein
MENTITPTYKVSVTFIWHYADNSKRKIQKGGYISESGTQDEIVQSFVDSFIGNYTIGICKVEDLKVHRFDRVLTIDEWVEKYNPIKNHIDENTSFDGCAFETYDEELEFVQSQNPHNIWTMVNAGDESYIVPGFRWIDRDLYFVTEKPFTEENLREEYLVI